MKQMTDIPIEVKYKDKLAKRKREYQAMTATEIEAVYGKAITYLRDTTHEANIEDWELALRKYEIIEDELRRRGLTSVIDKMFPEKEAEKVEPPAQLGLDS